MEVVHHTRNIRLAPRKLRLVIEKVKHQPAMTALALLPLVNKRGSLHVGKSLKAAIEAAKDQNLDADSLIIQRIFCDEGSAMKRFIGHSRGRFASIMKQHSHLTIVLKGETATKSSKKVRTVKEEAAAESTTQESKE